MKLLEEMKVRRLFCDDRTGSVFQARGLQAGEMSEMWNPTHPEITRDIHRQYLKAGADTMGTNTFGANGFRYEGNLEEIITAVVGHAEAAVEGAGHGYVALGVGPTGKLLKPPGGPDFEDVVSLYKEVVAYDVKAGADLVFITTISGSYELKTAVLAAREAGVDPMTGENIPVSTSVTFDEKRKLLTGRSVESIVVLLRGLWADALGIDYGLGPEQIKGILGDILEVTSLPVMANPNAGLPRSESGKTVYDISEDQFAQVMREIVDMGTAVVGGCCGITPGHVRETVKLCKDIPIRWPEKKRRTVISSYARTVVVDRKTVIIRERINPTGKSKSKQTLRNHNLGYILGEGVSRQDNGANVLDVNVGLSEIDGPSIIEEVVKELQGIIDPPLQIDTSNIEAMERAMRAYNGKPLINSVSGKAEVISQMFPLVAKYDGVVVELRLDEDGIPETTEGHITVGRKIIDTVANYGVGPEDIILDGLCMTANSDGRGAPTTLETLRRIRNGLGGKSVPGMSNISFGLPQREVINGTSLTMVIEAGPNMAIINLNSEAMMHAFHSFNTLMDRDPQCSRHVSIYSGQAPGLGRTIGENSVGQAAGNGGQTPGVSSALPGGGDAGVFLTSVIERGLKDTAHQTVGALLEKRDALDIIDNHAVPALDRVDKGLEKGTVFPPQLLMSAETAKVAFEVTKIRMNRSGQVRGKKDTIIPATVKGDIYDVGKNVVKVFLRNYGYDVMSLGKDVPSERIVEKAVKGKIPFVGFSALMATTVPSTEEIIQKLRAIAPSVKVMMGKAVLTREYVQTIEVDMYYRDAIVSVSYVESIFAR